MSHLEEPFASQQVQREVLDGFFLPATIFSHPKLFFFFPPSENKCSYNAGLYTQRILYKRKSWVCLFALWVIFLQQMKIPN